MLLKEPKETALSLGMGLFRALWITVSRDPWQGQGRAVTSAGSLPMAEQTMVSKPQGPQMAAFYVLTCLCYIVVFFFFPLWNSCVINEMR